MNSHELKKLKGLSIPVANIPFDIDPKILKSNKLFISETRRVILSIISGAVLTLAPKDGCGYINKYKSDWEVLDLSFSKMISHLDILYFESGNLETGESHYVFYDIEKESFRYNKRIFLTEVL